MRKISGKDNDRIKKMIRIRKDPRKSGLIFIEGIRVVTDALNSGMVFESLYLTEQRSEDLHEELFKATDEIFLITDDIAVRISQTMNPQGVFALIKVPETLAADLKSMTECKRLMICDGISDPGNMGTIIRSADAFGFDGVVLSPDCVSPYNDKVLRSSAGSVFRTRIFSVPSLGETLRNLKANGFSIYAAALEGEPLSNDYIFDIPCGIIVGNEGNGISEDSYEIADRILRIPMSGRAESLNAAVAASLLAFLCRDDRNEY